MMVCNGEFPSHDDWCRKTKMSSGTQLACRCGDVTCATARHAVLNLPVGGFPDEEEELPAKATSGKETEEHARVVVFEHMGEEDRKLLKVNGSLCQGRNLGALRPTNKHDQCNHSSRHHQQWTDCSSCLCSGLSACYCKGQQHSVAGCKTVLMVLFDDQLLSLIPQQGWPVPAPSAVKHLNFCRIACMAWCLYPAAVDGGWHPSALLSLAQPLNSMNNPSALRPCLMPHGCPIFCIQLLYTWSMMRNPQNVVF